MLTAGLLFYLSYWLITSKTDVLISSGSRDFKLFEKMFDRSLVAKLIVVGIVFLAAPIYFIFVNSMQELINIHCFFAALIIFWMDACWRVEFELEPALCPDCRYLLSGEWRP